MQLLDRNTYAILTATTAELYEQANWCKEIEAELDEIESGLDELLLIFLVEHWSFNDYVIDRLCMAVTCNICRHQDRETVVRHLLSTFFANRYEFMCTVADAKIAIMVAAQPQMQKNLVVLKPILSDMPVESVQVLSEELMLYSAIQRSFDVLEDCCDGDVSSYTKEYIIQMVWDVVPSEFIETITNVDATIDNIFDLYFSDRHRAFLEKYSSQN